MPSSSQRRRKPPGEVAALIFAVGSMFVLIGMAVGFWIVAPDPVPSHFDFAGRADDWSSKAGTVGSLLPLGLGISIVFSIRWIWERVPAAFLNIPYRDYWLEEGNRDYLFDCLLQFLRITAGCMSLLFAWLLLSILLTGLGMQLPGSAMWAGTLAFLVCVGLATWNLVRRLTP